MPLTDFVNATQSSTFRFDSSTNRYIIGPTIELRLPAGFGIEFDALYRRLHYTGAGLNLIDTFNTSSTTGNLWEFPLLLKYRFPTPVVKPYIDAGVAWDHLSGLTQTVTRGVIPNGPTVTTTSTPDELHKNGTVGFVVGAGLDIHVLLHISPEIRYTRWGSEHLRDAAGLLRSNQNQAEFLVGITF